LHGELEKLRDDQIYMERDISCLQARWHAVREEKAKAANLLRDVTKAEEDLERLAEEKSQLDLDVKVRLMSVLDCFPHVFLCVTISKSIVNWRL